MLTRLGFRRYLEGLEAGDWWTHTAWMWVRDADRAQVDLHWALAGATVDGERVWDVLRPRTTTIERART